MQKLLICEVLQKAHSAKTKAEKIKILRDNNSQALRTMFIINFDETVVPRVPLGEDVPYRPNEAPMGTEHTNLLNEAKKVYYYFKGGADNLSNMKVENMLFNYWKVCIKMTLLHSLRQSTKYYIRSIVLPRR